MTVLVDEVLRPALAEAGYRLRPSASFARRSARARGSSSRCRTSLPLVILRGSGETTAALAREAASHGVRTLAHAEGGGVLYVGAAADPAKAEALVARASTGSASATGSTSCSSIARRGMLPQLHAALAAARARGSRAGRDRARVGERRRARRVVTVRTVDSLEDAVALANGETSGLAASIVTEDEAAAGRFLAGYRGTTALWNATTRFTDGFALTGSPETGINVDRVPGRAAR